MIEHVVRIRTEQMQAPWRKIENSSLRPKRPGYIHVHCQIHPWFRAKLFFKGDDFPVVWKQADRLIAQHTDYRRLVEVSDEELRRLVDQRASLADQHGHPAPKRLRDGSGDPRRQGDRLGSDR